MKLTAHMTELSNGRKVLRISISNGNGQIRAVDMDAEFVTAEKLPAVIKTLNEGAATLPGWKSPD